MYVHYMTECLWTPNYNTHMCLSKVQIMSPPFTNLKTSPLDFWSLAVGICAYAATRALVRSRTDVR